LTNYDIILATPLKGFKGVTTVKEMLQELLIKVWNEEEGFSGKRPFGNSGWKYDVAAVLISQGYLPGELDEEGYIDSVDMVEFDTLVTKLIKYIFSQ
jgi:hypothetical protein